MNDPGEQPLQEEHPDILGHAKAPVADRSVDRNADRFKPTINADWSKREPINPDWRSARNRASRGATRRMRRAPPIVPTSAQEIPIWLQQGGWRFVAGAAVVFILLLTVLLWNNPGARSNESQTGTVFPEDTTINMDSDGTLPLDEPAPVIEPPPPPPAPMFIIANTGGWGLSLRSAANVNSEVLATLPDGTRVEQIGDDVSDMGYTWRQVRTDEGQEGWVAVDWLQPAP